MGEDVNFEALITKKNIVMGMKMVDSYFAYKRKIRRKMNPVKSYIEQHFIDRIIETRFINWLKSFALKLCSSKVFIVVAGVIVGLGLFSVLQTENLRFLFMGIMLQIFPIEILAKRTSSKWAILFSLLLIIVFLSLSLASPYRILILGYKL